MNKLVQPRKILNKSEKQVANPRSLSLPINASRAKRIGKLRASAEQDNREREKNKIGKSKSTKAKSVKAKLATAKCVKAASAKAKSPKAKILQL